ncbi:uncharacterized protein K02A2.6-like [Lytechinus variegatus]|uniref:uncharacterized protein K02A2.6-like n=1 Tax=Lytechinus variegatus TaxID=7654 RepID=UPI001BB274E2|nr:uncharacterized protein K02A2.6-like [Lytechinus variegatus]
MAASSNFPVPSPMDMKGDLRGNWKFFQSQWENYEIALELDKKPDKVRVATLVSLIGKECYKLYTTLEESQKTTTTQILDAMKKHFDPTTNVIFERYQFNTRNQGERETIDQYVTALRSLAETCEFDTLRDDLIRDRIVLGTNDPDVRARLLRGENLTLQKVIDVCRSAEVTKQQLKSIESASTHTESVQAVYKKHVKPRKANSGHEKSHSKGQQKTQMIRNCKYCGGEHRREKTACPAWGKQCGNCKKNNHFSKKCLAKGPKPVRSLDDEDDDLSDESIYTIERISSVGSNGKRWRANVIYRANGSDKKEMNSQIDTGATVNVLSYTDLCDVLQDGNPRLEHSKVRLKPFKGKLIKPKGQTALEVQVNNGPVHLLQFQIVDGSSQVPILSGDSSEDLGLVTRNNPERIEILSQATEQPLTKEQIMKEYKDVFTGLGCLPGEYHLETDKTVKPVQHMPRRVPAALKPSLKDKISELEEKGVIKKVTTPTEWISSMVAVKKPGKLRICIDPKDLNKALKRSHYPMPTIEEILPQLSQAKVFTILDAKDGYWQVKLDKESSFLTTFWTPFGRYRWLRMPFGIATAPEEYQRRQHEVVQGLPGVEAIVDDLLVYGSGETMEEAIINHDQNLRRLLERARQVGLKFNKTKIQLKQTEVRYIGHVLTDKGLCPDPEKIRAVAELERPRDVKTVQRFVGFVNYLAKFLPHLSEECEPLRQLTLKEVKWFWGPAQERAYSRVKKLVTTAPVLRYYDVNEEVTIQCDASDTGLGATLMQKSQPVAFASRALTETERRYAQIEKECLAIVFACEHFHQYLFGKETVTVESDHKPLQSIFLKPLLSAPKRLQRMLLRLQKYNLQVTYKQGKLMYVADMLSRAALPLKTQGEGGYYEIYTVSQQRQREFEEINPRESVNFTDKRFKQVEEMTQKDEILQVLKQVVIEGWPDTVNTVPVEIREYWAYRDEITSHNGILYKANRVIIPKRLRGELLQRVHASHQGMESSLRKARETIFWPKMNHEIRDVVRQCSVCNEHQAQQAKQPLLPREVPDRPWKTLGTDLFTLNGKDYLITVDYYSDFWEVDELQSTTSADVITCLKSQFSRHGIPKEVISDNGPQYSSDEFKCFMEEWEIHHTTSSPHHPQSNGKAESAVKIAKNIMKKCAKSGTDIYKAILEWRNTPTEGMQSSPVQRLMSRRTQTTLPTAQHLLKPKVVTGVKRKKVEKGKKAKTQFDKSTKELPDLKVGQAVRVQLAINKGKPTWQLGVCMRKLSPRSYVVKVNEQLYRRNRKRIQSTYESLPATPDVWTDIQPTTNTTGPQYNNPGDEEQREQQQQATPSPVVAHTRTRTIRPPSRYKDYVQP